LGSHPVAVVQYTHTHKQYRERYKTNNTYNTKIWKSAGRALSCGTFFGVLIISRGLGPHDRQTSRHLTTSFWWDFLKIESVAITQEARRTLNVTLQSLLQTLTNKLLKKLQDTAKGVNGLRGGGGTWSASAVIGHCLSHCCYI